jgi:hypothetical protein
MRTARALATVLLSALMGLGTPPSAEALLPSALAPLVKHALTLTEEAIEGLARIASKPGGSKEVGKKLGQMQLPEAVLSDTYARVAIAQGKLERQEAQQMINSLGDVQGFRSTMSKVVGASDVKTTGHLSELRIAHSAHERGFEVRGIGVSFNDSKKGAPTDIDVLLERGGRVVAIEAKDYAAQTRIDMVSFRADMDTLVEYVRQSRDQKVIPVFSITHEPAEPRDFALLRKEAKRRDVELIVGSPQEQARLIAQLVKLK